MAISLRQFVDKYELKTCAHPRGVKGQCVCLIRCYFDEVLELPQPPVVQSAQDLWHAIDDENLVKVINSALAIPHPGDIFIMSNFPGNPHGHTGIVLEGRFLSFRSFDSNWSIPLIATKETHNYIQPRILGWFRKPATRSTLSRVNEALRGCNDDPTRSVGTLTLSKWWQNQVVRRPWKFTDDQDGYDALVGAILWHQERKKYPHDN